MEDLEIGTYKEILILYDIIYGFIYALMITIGMLLFAYLMGLLVKSIYGVITRLFGNVIANIVINRLTFIGVIHHELSHALVAFITGAKVTSIELFKVNKHDNTLGGVRFVPRGNYLIRSIQISLSSIAPVFIGVINLSLMYRYLFDLVINTNNIWIIVLYFYTLFSIMIHITMSKQDLKNLKNSLLGFIISLGLIMSTIMIII